MSEVGDFVAQRRGDDVVALQADALIAVSPEFLVNHDKRYVRVDGDRLVLLGEYHYLATGESDGWGNPLYRRVMNEGDL